MTEHRAQGALAERSGALVFLDDLAAYLGTTKAEAAASIQRLVAQGWLRPLEDGTYQLTAPGDNRL